MIDTGELRLLLHHHRHPRVRPEWQGERTHPTYALKQVSNTFALALASVVFPAPECP